MNNHQSSPRPYALLSWFIGGFGMHFWFYSALLIYPANKFRDIIMTTQMLYWSLWGALLIWLCTVAQLNHPALPKPLNKIREVILDPLESLRVDEGALLILCCSPAVQFNYNKLYYHLESLRVAWKALPELLDALLLCGSVAFLLSN